VRASRFSCPRKNVPRQGEFALDTVPSDLSGLQLNDVHRLELEDAVKRRDYNTRRLSLSKTAGRDPNSVRAGKTPCDGRRNVFPGRPIPQCRHRLEKAEAIAPLDDPSKFTLAMAYVKLNRRDWARPELEKLAADTPQDPLYLYWLARLDYDAQNYAAAHYPVKKVVELDRR